MRLAYELHAIIEKLRLEMVEIFKTEEALLVVWDKLQILGGIKDQLNIKMGEGESMTCSRCA